MSRTSSAVKRRYNEKAYDRLAITVPNGRKADIERHVDGKTTVNGLVNDLLKAELGMSADEWKRKPGDPHG